MLLLPSVLCCNKASRAGCVRSRQGCRGPEAWDCAEAAARRTLEHAQGGEGGGGGGARAAAFLAVEKVRVEVVIMAGRKEMF